MELFSNYNKLVYGETSFSDAMALDCKNRNIQTEEQLKTMSTNSRRCKRPSKISGPMVQN